MVISKSTLLHLRFPFSYFLMPVYMLAITVSQAVDEGKAVMIFIILHLLVFPASNGFNSFYDRDEESIGGLRRPPKVTPDLLAVSLVMDACAVVLSFAVHPLFALGCFVYGLASKAYSWDKTRVKRYPLAGWLFAGFGQGTFVFALVLLCVRNPDLGGLAAPPGAIPALLAGLFILGFYPLTQVYQHNEDARRGDRTISILLGIRCTFLLCIPLLAAAIAGLALYFRFYFSPYLAAVFVIAQSPSAFYLVAWLIRVLKNRDRADYAYAMGMNFIAATCINLFCVYALVVQEGFCR